MRSGFRELAFGNKLPGLYQRALFLGVGLFAKSSSTRSKSLASLPPLNKGPPSHTRKAHGPVHVPKCQPPMQRLRHSMLVGFQVQNPEVIVTLQPSRLDRWWRRQLRCPLVNLVISGDGTFVDRLVFLGARLSSKRISALSGNRLRPSPQIILPVVAS